MTYRVLLLCLVFSGAASLSYELLWVRLLTLSFGSTTLSFSTVLALFLGGLALGALFAGRHLSRIRRPVLVYARIELAMGVLGLALYPALSRLGEIFALVDPGSGLGGALVRVLFAGPLLLVPTMLMGATLPVLSLAVIDRDSEVGRRASQVYGFNTLGACLGAYAVTYHLLAHFGVFGSVASTAGLNLIVGAVASLVSSRTERPAAPGSALPAPVAPSGRAEVSSSVGLTTIVLLLTFVSGFGFLCFEVVWARVFSLLLGGSIYGVGSVLICFLVGIAAGSVVAARYADRADVGRLYASLQAIVVVSITALAWSFPRVGYELSVLALDRSNPILSRHLELLVVLVCLLVPTAAAGASFPFLLRIISPEAEGTGRRLGLLYSVNTAGSISGSLLAGFLFLPVLGSEATAYLGLLLAALSVGLAVVFLARSAPLRGRVIISVAALTALVTYPGLRIRLIAQEGDPSKSYPGYLTSQLQAESQIISFVDGRTSLVQVSRKGDSTGLILNRLGQGGIHDIPPRYILESSLVGLVPLSHHVGPRNALVVGLGAGATVELMNELGVSRIQVVELEQEVIHAVDLIFRGQSPLRRTGVELEVDDARHHLLINARRGGTKYDLITSMPSHPWVAASIFTREFFELARANLTPGGVFSTWFGARQIAGPVTESMLRAFIAAFPYYVVYYFPRVGAYYLVGSAGPVPLQRPTLERLLKHPRVLEHPELEDPFYLPAHVIATGAPGVAVLPDGPINTDDSAFVEVHGPRVPGATGRIDRFFPVDYLAPFAVQPADPDFYLELMERFLGSPGGVWPVKPVARDPERAERLLRILPRELLGEERRTYLEARLSSLGGDVRRSRTELQRVGSSSTAVALRARRFLALSLFEENPPLASEVETALWTGDALARLLEIDRPRGLQVLATVEMNDTDHLLGLIQHLSRGATDLTLPAPPGFESSVREFLPTTRNQALLELCATYARVRERRALLVLCEGQLSRTRAEASMQLRERAERARQAGDLSSAAEILARALELSPSDLKLTRRLMRVALQAGREIDLSTWLGPARLHLRNEELEAHLAEVKRQISSGYAP